MINPNHKVISLNEVEGVFRGNMSSNYKDTYCYKEAEKLKRYRKIYKKATKKIYLKWLKKYQMKIHKKKRINKKFYNKYGINRDLIQIEKDK